jgi:hypothetical protein
MTMLETAHRRASSYPGELDGWTPKVPSRRDVWRHRFIDEFAPSPGDDLTRRRSKLTIPTDVERNSRQSKAGAQEDCANPAEMTGTLDQIFDVVQRQYR